MKEILGIFKHISYLRHTGSHRTSDGFKYYFCEGIEITGPFFSELLPLDYQDLLKLEQFTQSVRKQYEESDTDYTYSDGYQCAYENEIALDLGLCDYFNLNFSEKYNFIL